MEKHFLDDFVQKQGWKRAECVQPSTPWYNAEGDCILFQSEECACIGERVDDILTILRSAEHGRAVGFQIKGVRALCESLGYEPPESQAPATSGGIERLTLNLLLLKAYETGPNSIARRTAYASAFGEQSPLSAAV